jgi:putative SOS response-associated peptidase YedK
MCGRYEFNPDTGEMERLHPIKENKGYDFSKPNYNTAPTQTMPVLVRDQGGLLLRPMKWGIHRNIGPTIEKDIINTRADKAFTPFWGKTVRTSRCLIPATGFYEWKITDGSKQPYYIHLKGGHLYNFAGIYSQNSEGELSYSIMTTTPNKEMGEIHDRMPVILRPNVELDWLGIENEDALAELMKPLPDGSLDMYPISKEVNSVRNNNPSLSDRL